MLKRFTVSYLHRGILALIAISCLITLPISSQAPVSPQAPPPPRQPSAQNPDKQNPANAPEKHITPEEAQKLFGLVDQLIKFSSEESGLPVKSQVKRQLTTRAAVEAYLKDKFNDDEDAKRMQRSEIVLKKFGFLDRDFDLKPFLLALLKEQIEAYYDPKDKTINMLDWVSVDDQEPVLAHELTHALQDQHINLDKWSDQTPPDVSTTASEDNDHLAKDELDTARDAVTEGQATAVMVDNILKPKGKSLLKDPEYGELLKQQMTGTDNSPVLARAPLLLSESLIFPYREGLSFEQDVWMDRGQAAAFTGALDRPPSSTWEVMNPREYEQHHVPNIPFLPDVHPLLDATYRPYDIGQVGELDVQILANLFGGERAARNLTSAWDGGIYWAGQRLNATPAEQATTKSISFFYFSAWKNVASATAFANLYADELSHRYSGLKEDKTGSPGDKADDSSSERVWSTNEGPVVITQRGKLVFVSESFDLPLARKLATLVLAGQASGPLRTASNAAPGDPPLAARNVAPDTLTAPIVRFLSHCGVAKAVVDAVVRGTQQPVQ